jgi:hypothetical protein
MVTVLRVPADPGELLALLRVEDSSAAFSDMIGGGLLDDGMRGMVQGDPFVFCVDEQQVLRGLPVNDRAVVLSANVGQVDRRWLSGLCGDVLLVGLDRSGGDGNVPLGVVTAALRCDLGPIVVDGALLVRSRPRVTSEPRARRSGG